MTATPSSTPIPRPILLITPNGIRIQSAVLPQYTFRSDRQTDRWDRLQLCNKSAYAHALWIVSDALIITIRLLKVIWNKPRQRMDSRAACATGCAMPTADESNHSATAVCYIHTAVPHSLYTLLVLSHPQKKTVPSSGGNWTPI